MWIFTLLFVCCLVLGNYSQSKHARFSLIILITYSLLIPILCSYVVNNVLPIYYITYIEVFLLCLLLFCARDKFLILSFIFSFGFKGMDIIISTTEWIGDIPSWMWCDNYTVLFLSSYLGCYFVKEDKRFITSVSLDPEVVGYKIYILNLVLLLVMIIHYN